MERNERLEGKGRNYQDVYVRWDFPNEGWVKLNTDGASKGNPGQAGAGGILGDATGMVLGLCCSQL